ncbi:MAG: sulfurtransferase TusA family protein [Hydrogenovibrio sp.]|uniref:sulfurtransferase TusA family protein n=1 Tax=Hydrogenovibrio sp. TaxID=2065821 RepID=UPI00287002FD|nr:sulfurtransferase TusA family protein [Hydrogenovibrio sp.]MDR9498858.1 sulfurtransferase TusA family protein [Hydrogenovibrio sp.]
METDKIDAPSSETIPLDVSGLKCPMPVIKLQQTIRQLQNGTNLAGENTDSNERNHDQNRVQPNWVIEVQSTDPSAPKDMESWCRVNRHEFLGCEAHDTGHTCRIRVIFFGA